jgi:GT2 family glycosyltransferase
MQVSVIIPTMKGREELLKKLLSTIPTQYEVVVVDDENLLLAAKRNKGAMKAKGEYLFFVDDDNYLAPGAIEAALEVAQQPGIGVVGFMACYDDHQDLVADGGSNRNYLTGFTSGVNTNSYWPDLTKTPYEVDEIANAFLMHSELFFELQGLDEKNFPIDLDEADFCKRVKNGGSKIMMCPMARCYHKSQTYSHIPDFRRPMNAYFMGRNRVLYQGKHNHPVRYWLYVGLFVPVFVCFYSASLLYRRKPGLIRHFLEGVWHGIQGRLENRYQKR